MKAAVWHGPRDIRIEQQPVTFCETGHRVAQGAELCFQLAQEIKLLIRLPG